MQNNKVVCGFYKTGTHEVVPFERCFIQPDISTKIAILIKDIANELKIPAYDEISHKGSIRHVLIRNTVNDEYMVVIITNGNNLINSKLIVERIRTNFPEVKNLVISSGNIQNKLTYEYERNGNINKIFLNDVVINNYVYDDLNRLIYETNKYSPPPNAYYRYDTNGNIIWKYVGGPDTDTNYVFGYDDYIKDRLTSITIDYQVKKLEYNILSLEIQHSMEPV